MERTFLAVAIGFLGLSLIACSMRDEDVPPARPKLPPARPRADVFRIPPEALAAMPCACTVH